VSGHRHGPNEFICDDGDCPGLPDREPNPVAVRRIVAHLWGEDFINLRAAVESFGNGWTVVPKDKEDG
jgi:hypothetical protein